MALTAAQRAVILTGSRPAWATGMDMAWDFTTNRTWTANPITDTHSATIYAQYQNGSFAPFAANTLVRTDLGLQTVPTRTNLLLWSQQFDNASWGKLNVSITANQLIAPDGTLTGDKIVETTGTATHNINQSVIKAAVAVQYTISTYAFPAERNAVSLVGSFGANGVFARFSLTDAGSVITAATAFGVGFTAGSASISRSGNGWYFISLTFTSDASTAIVPTLQLYNGSSDSYTGVAGSGAFFWQAQLEAAAFASPPIVTTSSSATVNGNQQVVDLTGRLGSGVGVIWRFNMLDTTAQFKRIMGFNDGSGNNGFYVYGDVGSGNPLSQVVAASANQGNVSWPGANVAGIQTWVMCAGPNYHRGQKIGQSAPAADTTVTWPTMTQLTIAGAGYNAFDNAYQRTMQIGVKLGTANDAMFNDLVAKATILAAVS